MTNTNNLKTSPKKAVNAFKINQALIGLELGNTDYSILNYFDFFCRQVSMGGTYFMHVLPRFSLLNALYEKETQSLISQYTVDEDMMNRMAEKVKSYMPLNPDLYQEYDVVEGDPLEELMKSAKNIDADLIVIGQEQGVYNHAILAKNLARNTKADALIIPKGAKPKISTILVPIDFSENSTEALQKAIAIHRNLLEPCRLICINVYSMPSTNYFRNEGPWLEEKKRVESNLNDGFKAFLNSVAGDYQNKIEVALVERESTGTANFIMDYAIENKVDFMVMGARGHSKVHLLLMGSVTEGVLDLNTSIPTLVVK